MNVASLIKKLQKFPPQREVRIYVDRGADPLQDLLIHGVGKNAEFCDVNRIYGYGERSMYDVKRGPREKANYDGEFPIVLLTLL